MTGFLPTSETPEHEEVPQTPTTTEVTEAPASGSPTSAAHYTSPYPDPSHPRTLPEGASGTSPESSMSSARMRATSGLAMSTSFDQAVDAFDVLEALTGEDMERLRARRMRGTQAVADQDGRVNNNGLARPTELTLGMVAKEVKDDVLPLKSNFYDWAVEYFREPQMKVSSLTDMLEHQTDTGS